MSDEPSNTKINKSTNKNKRTEEIDETLNCSSLKCFGEEGSKQLQCCACQRWVHYRCTELPAYMIQAFIEKRIKKYYYCACCVTVPKELEIELQLETSEQKEIKRLRREVRRCENLIKVVEENSRMANKLLAEKANTIDEGKIEQMIDKKMEKIEAILVQHQKATENKTYASVAQQNEQQNDFKTIMKLARIEEISDERDRRVRENNVILHGVKEGEDESAEERSAKDKIYVNKFFETLEETGRTPSFIGRIGKKTEKNRPIKIAFNSENDKKTIFRKLKMLKNKEEYKGVAVAEDFTESERKVLKLWSDKAKERNKDETNGAIWRVRGSPKKGTMHLKKFPAPPASQK